MPNIRNIRTMIDETIAPEFDAFFSETLYNSLLFCSVKAVCVDL